MISKKKDAFLDLKKIISEEKKIIDEISSLLESNTNNNESSAILSQINSLKQHLNQGNNKIPTLINQLNLVKVLDNAGNEKIVDEAIKISKAKKPEKSFIQKFEEDRELSKEYKISKIEKEVVKRIERNKKEIAKKKQKKPNIYAGISSRIFSDYARPWLKAKPFRV